MTCPLPPAPARKACVCGHRPNGHFIAECRVCRTYRKTHGGQPPTRRTRVLLTTVAMGALTLSAAIATAQPLPIPAPEFTTCEQLVSAWVEAHSVTLGVVGVLALRVAGKMM